jgi:hypothetical protein
MKFGVRYVKVVVETYRKIFKHFAYNAVYVLTDINLATIRDLQSFRATFNVIRICTGRNYAQNIMHLILLLGQNLY